MKYCAKYAIMGNAVVDINSAARSLDGYAQRLVKIRSTMNSFDELKSLQNSIASRVTAVNKAATVIKNSAVCLDNVRAAYIAAEKKAHLKLNRRLSLKGAITAGVGRVTVLGTGGMRQPKIKWGKLILAGAGVGTAVVVKTWPKINWGSFKDWLKRKLPGGNKPKPGNFTLEQEKAADRRMQEEIRKLQRNAVDKWNNAKTEKEKKQILTDFLADVQRVMGTSAKARISFRKLQYNDKGMTIGGYNPTTKRITLNKRLLNTPDGIRLFETVVHEVRHAYQHEAAFGNKHTVSAETRAAWKHNLRFWNYKRPGRSDKSFDAYWNQPVEKDAREFSRGW